MDIDRIKNNLVFYNEILREKSPSEIISWINSKANNPVITTNFRELSSTLLHAVNKVNSEIPVIWIDSGYNTSYTYKHANDVIDKFRLNIKLYVPRSTVAFRDIKFGIPSSESELFYDFVQEVKLEPFERALSEIQPDVWFTNIRKDQTETRKNLDILSVDRRGILKVAPFFYWTKEELESYITEHNLSSESRYYDPTKVTSNSECGIHI